LFSCCEAIVEQSEKWQGLSSHVIVAAGVLTSVYSQPSIDIAVVIRPATMPSCALCQ
jgi:hypothetical protein